MNGNCKVNLVVVNYNNSSSTIDLLNSLSNCWDFIAQLVIVDNHSSKIEVDLLKTIKNEKVSLVFLGSNTGYFGGLNEGLLKLTDVINIPTIIGNNDLLFNKVFFENFSKIDTQNNVLVIAPSILTIDGVYQNPAQVNKPSLFKRFFYSIYFTNYHIGVFIYFIWKYLGLSAQSNRVKDNEAKRIYIGMGAAYILLPGFFKKNKNLNYPFFLYGEEAFLSKQVEDSGGTIWYEPSLEIVHLESVATIKMPNKEKYLLMKKAYDAYSIFWSK